tara:strand:+ start:4310 stop:5407 length:1098 start_codon:yes stop_codon:yes gene_type:complete
MTTNIKRPVIRYNNISLLKSTSPSFSIDSNSGDNVSFLSNVNGLSFNFSVPESKEDVISSRSVLNHFFKPGVEINIDIQKNENFIDLFPEYFVTEGLTGDLDKDFNLYGIISDEFQNDSISDGLTGFDMISFGNCKLNSFSMSQQVNGIIQSDYSFTAYNMKAERVVGENSSFSGELPCLNLTGDQTNIVSGLPLTYHFTGLNEKYQKSTTGSSVFPSYNTKILISGLSNIETFIIETDSIQNFNFDVDVPTKEIFTIGKKYPIKRKALFPSEGSLSFSNKISTFRVNRNEDFEDFSAERDLKKYLEKQVFYSIRIDMANTTGRSISLEMPSGRLQSQSYSTAVGSDFDCNLEFSFDLFGMNNSI